MFIDFCVGLVFSVDLPQQSMNSVDTIHEITITTDMHDKWSKEYSVDMYVFSTEISAYSVIMFSLEEQYLTSGSLY